MTFPHVFSLEVRVVWKTSPVMVQMSPHILQGIELCILNPFSMSHPIQPKRRPVVVGATGKLIVELKLSETVTSSFEVTGILSWLVDTGIMIFCFTSDFRFDRMTRLLNVWIMHELRCFPATSTASRTTFRPATVEGFTWVKGVPALATELLENFRLLGIEVTNHVGDWCMLVQKLLKDFWSNCDNSEVLHFCNLCIFYLYLNLN